jgi:hypothetical protein
MMKNIRHLITAAFLAAVNLTADAQGWQTVDDFQALPGLSSRGSDIGFDSQGRLFAVGGGDTDASGNSQLALVNISADQGATWNTPAQGFQPVWTWEHNRAFASAGNHLFLGGNGRNADWPGGSVSWFIRESVDGGATWVQTDGIPNDSAGCSDIAINPVTGDVYASGSSGSIGGLIRKRAANASTFLAVYSNGVGDVGIFWSLAFHPNGAIFAAGNKIDAATGAGNWLVLRSGSGEAGTWQPVDTFKNNEWTGLSAGGVLATGNGTIYVSGRAYNSRKHKYFWVVRASTDGGNTWTLSDSFNYGGYSVQVFEMTQDAAGNLYVCGQAEGASGLAWLVRKGAWTTTTVKGKTLTSLTWSTSDAYQLAAGKVALPLGITVDGLGNVFACGRAQDASGIEHWIVRKLAAR